MAELEGLNTDWFKVLFQMRIRKPTILDFGGTEKTNYYISLNYNGEEGVDKAHCAEFGEWWRVKTTIVSGVLQYFKWTVVIGMYHSSIDSSIMRFVLLGLSFAER